MVDQATAELRASQGKAAFLCGKGLADCPYSFHDGRQEWGDGWLAARDGEVSRFQAALGKGVTTEPNATVPETARKWLAYQHGLSDRDIDTAFSGFAHRNSNLGRLRQEALDVAEFVESLSK